MAIEGLPGGFYGYGRPRGYAESETERQIAEARAAAEEKARQDAEAAAAVAEIIKDQQAREAAARKIATEAKRFGIDPETFMYGGEELPVAPYLERIRPKAAPPPQIAKAPPVAPAPNVPPAAPEPATAGVPQEMDLADISRQIQEVGGDVARPRPALRWKFGGAEGDWNVYDPTLGRSVREGAPELPIERPAFGSLAPEQTAIEASLAPPGAGREHIGGGGYGVLPNLIPGRIPISAIEDAFRAAEMANLQAQTAQSQIVDVPGMGPMPMSDLVGIIRNAQRDPYQQRLNAGKNVQLEFEAKMQALTRQAEAIREKYGDNVPDEVRDEYDAAAKAVKAERDALLKMLGGYVTPSLFSEMG